MKQLSLSYVSCVFALILLTSPMMLFTYYVLHLTVQNVFKFQYPVRGNWYNSTKDKPLYKKGTFTSQYPVRGKGQNSTKDQSLYGKLEESHIRTYADFNINYTVVKPRYYSKETITGKRFVYLINAAKKKDQMLIKTLTENKERDVIWMTFADKSGDIYAPKSTICGGRNALVHYAVSLAAQMSDGGYEYYIIMDDDLKLSVTSEKNVSWKPWPEMAADPYKRFEEYLMHYRPIVGYVRYMEMVRQYVDIKRPVNLNWDYDECINAFHRDALSFLVPFDTVLDSGSWWYCTWITRQLISMLYHSYRYQCNSVHVDNTFHTNSAQYSQLQDFKIPRDMVSSALLRDVDGKPNASNPLHAAVLKGTSLPRNPLQMQPGPNIFVPGEAKHKGTHSYVVTPDFIKRYWDKNHPMIKKRLDWLEQPEVRKVLQMDSPNLPPFVPDTMYCPAPSKFSLKAT